MAGGLANIWKEWQILILVLLNFSLQVFLFLLSWIRRRKGYPFLRILLWLSYLLTDSTAIYTLGRLSISTNSSFREHQIIAFSAAFLLLHLGGPDNITAYSLEDNHLWLRHLLTFMVQVLGATYVLYRYIHGGSTFVWAIILMFVVGVAKYGERVWALKCANMDSIWSSLDISDRSSVRHPYLQQDREQQLVTDTEEVLLEAHYMFNFCKSLFMNDLKISTLEQRVVKLGMQHDGGKHMHKLIEMELSLMYDILYTKATVIHTWYGRSIRVFSLLATVASLLLFHLSRRDVYHKLDSAVTYTLIIWAVILEIAEVLRTIGSSWTCVFLHIRKWDRPCNYIMFVRRIVKVGQTRLCLDYIGQYNLLDFCTRDMTDLRGRIAKKVGLEDWWNKLHYSSTSSISKDIKEFVMQEIAKRENLLGDIRNAQGKWVIYQTRKIGADLSRSTKEIDFEKSILVWHVATDVYLCHCKEAGINCPAPLAMIVKQISNYMLYLLVHHPDMLPGPIRRRRFPELCASLVGLWHEHSQKVQRSNFSKGEKLAYLLLHEFADESNEEDELAHLDGAALAGCLIRNEFGVSDVLGLIAGVWFEMLCHAADHSRMESHVRQLHARQLSDGGEFLTVVWLLVEHIFSSDKKPRSDASHEISQQQDHHINGASVSAQLHDISDNADGISRHHDGFATMV